MKRPIILHPFLFALFPLVFLLSSHIEKLQWFQAFIPALVLIGLVSLVMLVCWLVYRNYYKAALFASVFIILFLGYSSLYTLATKWEMTFIYRYLVGIYFIIFIIAFWFINRINKNLFTTTTLLNIVALALVTYNLTLIFWQTLQFRKTNYPSDDITSFNKPSQTPDIYYFLLDGYARADVLQQLHEYDNTPFINALKARGFYVADSSHSNYPYTIASLASTLNFQYLTESPSEKGTWRQWRNMIHNSSAFRILKKCGYSIYTFPNGWEWLRIKEADHYQSTFHMDEIITTLFQMTPLRYMPGMKELIEPLRRDVVISPYKFIQNMDDASSKLVYVHSLCPHPPFIFGPDGETVKRYTRGWWSTEWLPGPGYRDQVSFINKLFLQTVDSILKHSKTPPIIVVQSDHGCMAGLRGETSKTENFHEKYANLCAVYFPNDKDSALYSTLTPVNIYRLIFNQFFGAQYDLLPDDSYYFKWGKNSKYENVTDKIREEESLQRVQ